jgi:hypothetical protein
LPAKNDDAVGQVNRGGLFAGKPRSYGAENDDAVGLVNRGGLFARRSERAAIRLAREEGDTILLT